MQGCPAREGREGRVWSLNPSRPGCTLRLSVSKLLEGQDLASHHYLQTARCW